MKRKILILGAILIFIFPNLLSLASADSIIIEDKINVKNNNPILQFIFENFILYLENIGDETAYNITISTHIKGFIIVGNEDNIFGNFSLVPGEKTGIIFFPLVFGFGPIKIIYTANAVNADSTSITLRAFLIGPYPWLLRL